MSLVSEAEILSKWYYLGEKLPMATGFCRVTGFAVKYIPRGGFTHKLAGKYIDFTKVCVVTEGNWEKLTINCHDKWYGESTEDQHRRLSNMPEVQIKIGELPETPFWVGDIVKTYNDRYPAAFNVEKINYYQGVETPVFHLSSPEHTEIHIENELTLIKRGNIWKLAHGEPLLFTNIVEEAVFYKSLGMSRRIIHQGKNEFPIGTAVWLLRHGIADQMKVKNGQKMTYVLIKYDNVEFGNRMRTCTLSSLELSQCGGGGSMS